LGRQFLTRQFGGTSRASGWAIKAAGRQEFVVMAAETIRTERNRSLRLVIAVDAAAECPRARHRTTHASRSHAFSTQRAEQRQEPTYLDPTGISLAKFFVLNDAIIARDPTSAEKARRFGAPSVQMEDGFAWLRGYARQRLQFRVDFRGKFRICAANLTGAQGQTKIGRRLQLPGFQKQQIIYHVRIPGHIQGPANGLSKRQSD
jgi:hypothetical protein